MNILSTKHRPQSAPAQPPQKQAKTDNQADPDKVELNSAFSVDRDLTYAVGATLCQVPGALVTVTGPMYGVPQIAATTLGGIMAVAGAKEMMTNRTLHGRINGGIHLAVGAMAAAAPWTGNLANGLYLTSIAALGVKALVDQPGNVFKKTASETASMVGEIFSHWDVDTKAACADCKA